MAQRKQHQRGQQRQHPAPLVEGTIHSFDFGGVSLAEYYGVPEGVTIEQLAFVFRNADGSAVGKTADESDIFYNVSDGSFEVAFTSPGGASTLETLGSTLPIVVQTTQDADLSLSVNGVEVATAYGIALNHDLLLDATGDYLLNVTATLDGATASAEATVFVMPETPPVVAPPAGIVDGINHINDNTVILQWTAPFKDFIFVVGDFNGWSLSEASMMNAVGDGETFWIQLDD